MTALTWDKVGERVYQGGIDRGVLYLHDGTVAVWNGLTGIEEASNSELKSFWLEGVKFLENLSPNDFAAKLKAFTYPDEFEGVNGVVVTSGLTYYDQPPKSFNLSYRTRVGNDVEGTEYGYKIHILYNVLANPETTAYDTLTDSGASIIEFAWSLTGTPPKLDNYRPTVHISIDSTKTDPEILKILEDILYGTETTEPRLPSIIEVAHFFGYLGALIIVDYGDGTWAAIDSADTYITMINDTTFQIDDADATYLDAVTYTISSTNVD